MIGDLCATCAPGFERKQADSVCDQCPDEGQNWAFLLLGIIGFGIILFFVDRMNASNVGNLRDSSAVVLKILCNFFILVSVIARNIGLPPLLVKVAKQNGAAFIGVLPISATLGIGGALKNPGTAVFSVSCLAQQVGNAGPDSLYPEYYSVIAGWSLIPAALALCSAIISTIWLIRRKAFNLSGALKSCIVVVMYFLHPMVTAFFLSVFECSRWDMETNLRYDSARLLINMSIDCYSVVHQRWMLASAIGIVVWSFGIPCFYWLKLRGIYYSRESLQHPDSLRKYGFLYDGFEPERYYYECIYMVRKALYLLAATLFWLQEGARTVVLLAMNCIFLSLHLRYLPFDNRAYKGFDHLETWSSITLITMLMGRVFQKIVEGMYDQMFPGKEEIWYLPGFASFLYFLLQAAYLLTRPFIWPIDSDPGWVPGFLKQKLLHRLKFSFIPPEDDDDGSIGLGEHCVLDKATTRRLEHRPSRCSSFFSLGPPRMLASRERDLFKAICSEAMEVLLRRHELCVGEAPEHISFPTLIIQFERLMTMCMVYAIRARISKRLMQEGRESIWKCLRGMGEDTIEYAGDLLQGRQAADPSETCAVDWHRRDDPKLLQESEVIRQPVSAEELHVALMSITGHLLRAKAEANPLRQLAEQNKGLLDMFANVSWIFEAVGHTKALEKFRREEPTADEDQDQADFNDDMPRVEIFEDACGLEVTDESLGEVPSDEPLQLPIGLLENGIPGQWSAVSDLWHLQSDAPEKPALALGVTPSASPEACASSRPGCKMGL